jgi:phosphoribosylamine--glycine ligase
VISGIPAAEASDPNVIVFHAGTQEKPGSLVTNGGRVLTVTALGEEFDAAFAKAYQALDHIHFEGIYYRRDIGHQVRT